MGCGGSSIEDAGLIPYEEDQAGSEAAEATIENEKPFGLLTDSQVSMICRNMFCDVFGMEEYEKQGYFVEHHLIHIVYPYQDWVKYPNGDHVLKGHTDVVSGLVISEDGRHLYTCSWDAHVTHWDLSNNEMIHQWVSHKGQILSIQVHPSGVIAAGSEDGCIKLWDAHSYQKKRMMRMGNDPIHSLKFNFDGNALISGSLTGFVNIWDINHGKLKLTVELAVGWLNSILLMNDMTTVIIGLNNGKVQGWDVTDKTHYSIFDKLSHKEAVTALSMNCDGTLLATLSMDRVVVLTWPGIREYRTLEIQLPISLAFSASDPRILAVAIADRTSVSLFDISKDPCVLIHCITGVGSGVTRMSFTPFGNRLVGGVYADGSVRVWDLDDVIRKHQIESRGQ